MADVLWSAPRATGPVDALIRMPGSKSLTARWLVLAALATGPTRLREPLISRDTRLMRDALERLGATIEDAGEDLLVDPLPDHRFSGELVDETPSADPIEIRAGLAGTVMRFVPLMAALHRGDVRFTGDDSALLRPMGPVLAALRAQGVEVTEHGEANRLPFTVHGRGALPGGLVELDASESSQFISNLLLVGARADDELIVRHVGETLPSLPHIEMTLEVLAHAGVAAEHRLADSGHHEWVVVPGPIDLGTVRVEPDLSNAGPFLAAAMVAGGEIAIADWPRRTSQAGDHFRDLLARMGGDVGWAKDGLCVAGTGEIRGIDVDLSACGELTPTIAALAALAESPSHLRGIGHLRGHETDRIHALAVELGKLGARTVEHPDSLEIHPQELTGGIMETYEDHRMATAAAILGLRIEDLTVVNIETTQKTLPDFVGMWLSMLHTESPAGRTW